jgi:DNA-3-methyladenine glycosylase II
MKRAVSLSFRIEPRGPFSLVLAGTYLQGFGPASGNTIVREGHIHVAFVPDDATEAVAVCLRAEGDAIVGEIAGEGDGDAIARQVVRILSLDVDAGEYTALGRRDPVIARVQERYPGLRPVLFFSPYEAAVWAIISQRVQGSQAIRIKRRMAEQLGQVVEIHGDRLQAFPGPERLVELEDFRGLFGRKAEYLREIAQTALEGRLDAARLRRLPEQEALTELRRIPGIGEFSSRLVLLRGVGMPDGTPPPEGRFLQALTLAYDLPGEPSPAQIAAITEPWRPFRAWVAFLLRVLLADEERAGR